MSCLTCFVTRIHSHSLAFTRIHLHSLAFAPSTSLARDRPTYRGDEGDDENGTGDVAVGKPATVNIVVLTLLC